MERKFSGIKFPNLEYTREVVRKLEQQENLEITVPFETISVCSASL